MSDPTSRAALLTSTAQIQSPCARSDRKAVRRARRAEQRATAPDPLLMAEEAAAERGCGLSTFWRDVKRGLLPPPIYVGPRMPRWRQSELRAAVEATRGGNRAAEIQDAA